MSEPKYIINEVWRNKLDEEIAAGHNAKSLYMLRSLKPVEPMTLNFLKELQNYGLQNQGTWVFPGWDGNSIANALKDFGELK